MFTQSQHQPQFDDQHGHQGAKSSIWVKCNRWLAPGIVAVALGCSKPQVALTETRATCTFISGLDASFSHRKALPGALNDYSEAASSLPGGGFVTLYRIDSTCQEVYNGPKPLGSEEFATSLVPRLSARATRDNTYLQILSAAISSRLATASGPTVIAISTDGFSEGMSRHDHDQLSKAVSTWAKNPKVVGIFVTDVNPRCMSVMRHDFEGAGPKLSITPDRLDSHGLVELFKRGASR